MPRFSKVHNPTHHQYTMVSLEDFQGVKNWLDPLVDEVLKNIAEEVADIARQSQPPEGFADSDKSTDVRRNLSGWPDDWYPHKHLRASIDVEPSHFKEGGWLVRAKRPHAHLVEYGHWMIHADGTPALDESGRPMFVPPHAFMRPAKDKVMARLGAMEL